MFWTSEEKWKLRELDRLAARLIAASLHGPKSAHFKLALEFFRRAVITRMVNNLGDEFVGFDPPIKTLSDRTLDHVFEQGDVSDKVVAAVLKELDENPQSEFSLALAGNDNWRTCVSYWREHQPQAELPMRVAS